MVFDQRIPGEELTVEFVVGVLALFHASRMANFWICRIR
jgi:hypothetical protein